MVLVVGNVECCDALVALALVLIIRQLQATVLAVVVAIDVGLAAILDVSRVAVLTVDDVESHLVAVAPARRIP